LEPVEPTTVTPRFEPAVSLTVGVSGSAGSVVTEPPGTECEAICTETLAQGTEVTLTAAERDGSAFVRWSGSKCEPVTKCSFVLDSPAKVAAVFACPHALTIEVEGLTGNRVTSSPAGIDCPNTCTAPFRHGAMVALTPVESGDGSFFVFWTGDCTGKEPCRLTLERPASVTARFNPPVD
jgi:trimeric autotransporter adhesin